MDGLKQFVYESIMSMIGTFDDNIGNAVGVLTGDIFSGNLYNTVAAISSVIKPMAYTIIAICFLIEFLKITINMDVLKWEFMLKVFLKLVVAKFAIDVTPELLSAIYKTGAAWIFNAADVNTASSLGEQVSPYLIEILNSIGWLEAIGLLASMAIAFLAVGVCSIIVVVIAYSRTVELLVMVTISPIPVSFIPIEERGNGMAKHFFLSFAGVVLQGLFIIVAIKLFNAICTSAIFDVFDQMAASGGTAAVGDIAFQLLLGALVLVMTVLKSGSWAKSILNAS